MSEPTANLSMHAATSTGGELHHTATISPAQWGDLIRIAEGKSTAKEAELQAEVDRLKAWKFLRHADGSIGVIQSMSDDEESYFQARPAASDTPIANDVLFRLVSALAPAEGK